MRFYLQTKFRGNLRRSSIFCFDLAWNDPIQNKCLSLILFNTFYRINLSELPQQQNVGEGLTSVYEVVEGAGIVYEEIDKVRESSKEREQPHTPQGDFGFTQCAAYGPSN